MTLIPSRSDAWGSRFGLATACGLWAALAAAPVAHGQCNPVEQAKLIASDAAANDYFGCSVAISGDTTVAGAYLDDHAGGVDAGAAYVYTRSDGVWTQQQKLIAADGAASDNFGNSVAIAGETVVVGAPLDDNAGGTDAGAAYVFIRSGGVWTQQAKLTAADAAANDQFGWTVTADDDTILVGAPLDDHAGGTDAGSAYVLVRTGSVWTQQTKLTADDAAANDQFGYSVALSGATSVVGSRFDFTSGEGPNAGSVYVFVRSGNVWTQQANLFMESLKLSYGQLGSSVAVSGDTAMGGAPFHDHFAWNDAGEAAVFIRSGSEWTEQSELGAFDAQANDSFGISVALSGDVIVAGAYLDTHSGGPTAGSAYVFTRAGGVWTERQKLIASDAAANDWFGKSVALSVDTAVVGSLRDDHAGGTNAGSAYVFKLSCDIDDDGVINEADNCATISNPGQEDADADGAGDECDNCPSFANSGQSDEDADGVGDVCDNCPTTSNLNQVDADGDSIGDVCDFCPTNAPGLPVDCAGRPHRDCNNDCLVDGQDVQCFVAELLGS